jgi:1,4-dihydroxy-2-naphthoyl-CoA hydrolase
MKIWQRDVDLAVVNKRGEDTLSDFLGIVFIELGDDYLTARMAVLPQHKQPIGIMHGGVSCVLAETVGSTAANFCVSADYYCVGLDINTNHIRSVKEGDIIAKATPFHLGKSTQVWGIEIKTGDDKLVSINRLTMAVLQRHR